MKEKNMKIDDLTRPGSNLRPIASTASHYATVVRASACIVENNSYNQEPLVKNFKPHMSFSVVPINNDKEIQNKFLVFGPVKML